jgi:hypothetical protein
MCRKGPRRPELAVGAPGFGPIAAESAFVVSLAGVHGERATRAGRGHKERMLRRHIYMERHHLKPELFGPFRSPFPSRSARLLRSEH